MPSPIQFEDLAHLLQHKGFTRRIVAKSYQVFTHKKSGAQISLPLQLRSPRGLANYTAAVRITLDNHGIMDTDAFYRWMYGHNGQATGKAKRRLPKDHKVPTSEAA